MKVLHSICQQIWKTQQWPQYWKRSVFIPIPKKGNAKESHTTTQLHSSHTLGGEGDGTPLQYSCLENPMDGGAWCPWGHKESDTTEQLHFKETMMAKDLVSYNGKVYNEAS